MSIITRVLGWILVLSGITALALAGVMWFDGKDVGKPAGQSWAENHPFSLTQSQHVVQEYVSPNLWDDYFVPFLGQSTWLALTEVTVAFLVLGVVFLLLGRRRRRTGAMFR